MLAVIGGGAWSGWSGRHGGNDTRAVVLRHILNSNTLPPAGIPCVTFNQIIQSPYPHQTPPVIAHTSQ